MLELGVPGPGGLAPTRADSPGLGWFGSCELGQVFIAWFWLLWQQVPCGDGVLFEHWRSPIPGRVVAVVAEGFPCAGLAMPRWRRVVSGGWVEGCLALSDSLLARRPKPGRPKPGLTEPGLTESGRMPHGSSSHGFGCSGNGFHPVTVFFEEWGSRIPGRAVVVVAVGFPLCRSRNAEAACRIRWVGRGLPGSSDGLLAGRPKPGRPKPGLTESGRMLHGLSSHGFGCPGNVFHTKTMLSRPRLAERGPADV